MANKPYPTPANLSEQLVNLGWRLATEMRALHNTVNTKVSRKDADAAYLGKTAKAESAKTADVATKATQDGNGKDIASTYALKTSIPIAMKGATSTAAGSAGTVPAPAAGDQAKFLTGSGTWRAALTSQTQADWNATSGVAAIKNKPTIPTKISQLTNDSGYLTTQVRADWNATTGYGVINNKPTIPTKVSQLTNDAGYTTGVGVMGSELGSIELTPLTTADHGGFIDFHWKGETTDYTSRISETSQSGRLDVDASNGFYVNGEQVVLSDSYDFVRSTGNRAEVAGYEGYTGIATATPLTSTQSVTLTSSDSLRFDSQNKAVLTINFSGGINGKVATKVIYCTNSSSGIVLNGVTRWGSDNTAPTIKKNAIFVVQFWDTEIHVNVASTWGD